MVSVSDSSTRSQSEPSVRPLIWCKGRPNDPTAISYWEGWYGPFVLVGLVEYEHATYPWFLNWRLGAYRNVEDAKGSLQFLLDNPDKITDF